MSRWRTRVGEKGAEELLKKTIENALKIKIVKAEQLSRINVETTVSQNNTALPTDARLYKRAIDVIVKESRRDNLTLRRTYIHVSKRTLIRSRRYAHARQMKRTAKQVKKLRTMLGSPIRDIERKTTGNPLMDTLKETSQKAEQNTHVPIKEVYVDRVYKGDGCDETSSL